MSYWESEKLVAERREGLILAEIEDHQAEIKALRKLIRENRKRIAECADMIDYNREKGTLR